MATLDEEGVPGVRRVRVWEVPRVAWTLALAFAGEDPDESPIPRRARTAIASTTAAGLAATVLLQFRDHYSSHDGLVVACLQRQGWRSTVAAVPVLVALVALTVIAMVDSGTAAASASAVLAGWIFAVLAMVGGLGYARRRYRPGAPSWRLHAPPATWTMSNVAVRPGASPLRLFEVRALVHERVAPGATVGCVAGSARTAEAYEKWRFVRVKPDDARMVLTIRRQLDRATGEAPPRTR